MDGSPGPVVAPHVSLAACLPAGTFDDQVQWCLPEEGCVTSAPIASGRGVEAHWREPPPQGRRAGTGPRPSGSPQRPLVEWGVDPPFPIPRDACHMTEGPGDLRFPRCGHCHRSQPPAHPGPRSRRRRLSKSTYFNRSRPSPIGCYVRVPSREPPGIRTAMLSHRGVAG